MNKVTHEKLISMANNMRKDILRMCFRCGNMGAHLGGSMSAVEIMAVLYGATMHIDPLNPLSDERDRFIMSKSHSIMAQYAALKQAGFLSDDEIANSMIDNQILYKHPCMNIQKGIEFSGGSLGQGLSLGVGTAIALKRRNNNSQVYIVVGDGECDEGSIWEAAALAGHLKLNNLTVIIDNNGLQNDGKTCDILNKDNMDQKWRAWGFETSLVNGHNVDSIYAALNIKNELPLAVIATTVKGNGISFAENVVDWHAAYLTKELYEQAMEELK